MIAGVHYHIATGHGSKNRGRLYLCQNKGKYGIFGCCEWPAWWDAKGRRPVKKL